MGTPPPPGIYVPAVLFFHDNEDLDLESIRKHVLRLAAGGVTGILVQGSNGEAQHLSHEERALAIRTTRAALDENGHKQVVVIAGCGAPSTRETIQLCKEANEAGATYALNLTPSIWPKSMTAANIIRFHQTVADASPIPTMVYNFPTVTAGLDLDSDVISTLALHPNIVGTKLSCGNIGKLHRITASIPQTQFAVFAGKSDVLLPGLLCGSSGAIAASVNLFPKFHSHLFALYQAGDIATAMKLQAKLGHGDWAGSKLGGIAGIKGAIVQHFGYGQPLARGPLQAADPKIYASPEGQILAALVAEEKQLNL